MKNKSPRGFTVLELLVVIAIIGVLTTIILSGMSLSRKRAADGRIKTELTQARNQAALYYSNHKNYGAFVGACNTDLSDPGQWPRNWGLVQTDPNIFTLPVAQGGLKEIVARIAQDKDPNGGMQCGVGSYWDNYSTGRPSYSWAIYVELNNGDRICMDASNNIRKYNSGETQFTDAGSCSNY